MNNEIINLIFLFCMLALTMLYTVSHVLSKMKVSKMRQMDQLMKQNIFKNEEISKDIKKEVDMLMIHADTQHDEEK